MHVCKFGNYIFYWVLFPFYKSFQPAYTCFLLTLIISKDEHRRWEVFLFPHHRILISNNNWSLLYLLICSILMFCLTISYLVSVNFGKVIPLNIKPITIEINTINKNLIYNNCLLYIIGISASFITAETRSC